MTESSPSGNPLVIFLLDIDGTLMPTNEIDNRCFWQAVDDVLGGAPEPVDLCGFRHVTDSGILQEWSEQERGSAPTAVETDAVRERFLELTRHAADRFPWLFRPTAGLQDWIQDHRKNGLVCIGLATGGWRHTACFKLGRADLGGYQLPLASSDEAISRTQIMQIALDRTLAHYAIPVTSRDQLQITYIGDGIWDLEASRKLGWEFIGIADDQQELKLKEAGARFVVRDFNQLRNQRDLA